MAKTQTNNKPTGWNKTYYTYLKVLKWLLIVALVLGLALEIWMSISIPDRFLVGMYIIIAFFGAVFVWFIGLLLVAFLYILRRWYIEWVNWMNNRL